MQASLALQWIDKDRTPETLGRLIAVCSFTSIVTFGSIWILFEWLSTAGDGPFLDYPWVYLIGGGIAAGIAVAACGVSFTISHIAAIVIPTAFGALWLISPAAVFLSGAVMAGLSLLIACNVPGRSALGNEVLVGRRPASIAAE